MEPVFNIRNLECQYIKGSTVLKIKELKIPKGKLVFLLGPSGVGKSTFIETLGLMNQTLHDTSNTTIEFFPAESKEVIEIKDAWKWEDSEISSFRNNYFSFIFQNTNLMPNFTAGENMCLGRMINGTALEEVKEEVLEIMESLDLPAEVFDKKVTELSGGQRQRLAFVRAVICNFSVLFGDEPTGNLDKKTAHKLMTILKNYLNKKNRTGIVVSHDINLALDFADVIYFLSKTEDESGGEIKPTNILIRSNQNSWEDIDGRKIDPPSDFILNQF